MAAFGVVRREMGPSNDMSEGILRNKEGESGGCQESISDQRGQVKMRDIRAKERGLNDTAKDYGPADEKVQTKGEGFRNFLWGWFPRRIGLKDWKCTRSARRLGGHGNLFKSFSRGDEGKGVSVDPGGRKDRGKERDF